MDWIGGYRMSDWGGLKEVREVREVGRGGKREDLADHSRRMDNDDDEKGRGNVMGEGEEEEESESKRQKDETIDPSGKGTRTRPLLVSSIQIDSG